MHKLLMLVLLCGITLADQSRNRGAINNLCQNLTATCTAGDHAACQGAKDTGCACDESHGTCTRGNYSTH